MTKSTIPLPTTTEADRVTNRQFAMPVELDESPHELNLADAEEMISPDFIIELEPWTLPGGGGSSWQ